MIDNIENDIKNRLIKILNFAEISVTFKENSDLSKSFESLGVDIDSIAMLQIISCIENEFGIVIKAEDIDQYLFSSPQSILNFIHKHINNVLA